MTRKIKVKNLEIGGGAPISVQSMTNTKTVDIDATVAQILALEQAGCDIIRLAVPDKLSAQALKSIVSQVNAPIVADIHFDYKLAIESVNNGVSKVRINPGNIGDSAKVKYLADYLNERNIPIRIGVNAGSLEKDLQGLSHVDAMVASALKHVKILEDAHFYNTIISVKSSSVKETIDAYRQLSKKVDYPLHVGVTEAGVFSRGVIKSAVGIGALLCDGIGDTIRVSLTDNPLTEVSVAKSILQSLDLTPYVDVIACPTCARTCINVQEIATNITELTKNIKKPLKIAVMGCIVNGLGEAGDCDFGVAGGVDKSIIFSKGKVLKTVPNADIYKELLGLL
ncbi:MAG: flavodoxin-dependent (E)-4-hydroxy-3-methylbut-2-enyl-diphosphate synthase [Clostridia bacterium]